MKTLQFLKTIRHLFDTMRNLENLQAWEAFLHTAKSGNISQTALLMDLDIAKVSRLISGLEKELGYALLQKNCRPFKPTRKGAQLVSVATPLVRGFRQMIEFSEGTAQKQLFRISSPIEIAQEFYSEKLLAYSRTHPSVQFEIIPEHSANALLRGEADLAVVNQWPTDTTNLIIRPFMQTATPVLCTPEYIRRFGLPKSPSDLVRHTGLLLKTANRHNTQFLYKGGEESGILKWKTLFLSHDQLTLKRLLLNHQGITVDLYFGHVLEEIKRGDIVPILPGWEREPWVMAMVTRQDQELQNAELKNFALWWNKSEASSALERVFNGRKIIDEAVRRMTDELLT
ncbi:LysR family transcriptional regulator [uncultured Parasutterella sp.]|nr:LysR family transcriptional regulator [uncultured Parasutterella sp.]